MAARDNVKPALRRTAVALAAFVLALTGADAQPLSVEGTLALVPFDTAPFPYDGIVPAPARGSSTWWPAAGAATPRHAAALYWEDETYGDSRSLLFIPPGFDPGKPATVVVFFHGNDAILERDVAGRQDVPGQLARSGLNAVLIAPQFAVNAFDSSAGRFWQPGAFAAYLREASDRLAILYGQPFLGVRFDPMPVVLVAYSGGYLPAAYAASIGGAGGRLCGVVLLDSLYGEQAAFAAWIEARGAGFFFSAYSASAQPGNDSLRRLLADRGIAYSSASRPRLAPASVSFLAAGSAVNHNDFVTRAWRSNPLEWLLSQVAANGMCRG